MNARFYNPSTGRFLTQDSYKGSAYEPWTQHLYVYTGNNPVNYVDPTGHARESAYDNNGGNWTPEYEEVKAAPPKAKNVERKNAQPINGSNHHTNFDKNKISQIKNDELIKAKALKYAIEADLGVGAGLGAKLNVLEIVDGEIGGSYDHFHIKYSDGKFTMGNQLNAGLSLEITEYVKVGGEYSAFRDVDKNRYLTPHYNFLSDPNTEKSWDYGLTIGKRIRGDVYKEGNNLTLSEGGLGILVSVNVSISINLDNFNKYINDAKQ